MEGIRRQVELFQKLRSSSRIEIKLIRLLESFNPNLAEDYLGAVKSFHREVEKHGSSVYTKRISWLKKFGEPFAFIAYFDEPLFLVLSHPISRFARARQYSILNNECKLCFDLALVPAYLGSLNIYTIVRLWSDGARKFFSPTATPLSETQEYWSLHPTRAGAELSSMNFLLKRHADIRFSSKYIQRLMKDYFAYFFWSFPRRGFSGCPHFIHDRDNIRTLFKVTKTIYSISGFYDDSLLIGRNRMAVKKVAVSGLVLDDLNPRFTRTHPILTSDILTDIKELKGRRFFINGVVSEFRRRGETRFNTLTVVAEYGVNHVELFMALIGMVIWTRFKNSKTLSHIGALEEIRADTVKIFKFLTKHIRFDKSFADLIEDPFRYALKQLSPIALVDNGNIYFCHPYLFSALEKYGLLTKAPTKQKLLAVLKLLEQAPVSTERDLYNSDEANMLKKKGVSKLQIVKALGDSVSGILLSRIFHKIFIDREGERAEGEMPKNGGQEEEISEGVVNVCPQCQGRGAVFEIQEQDLRTRVRIKQVKRRCRMCAGKGFLKTELD